MTTMNNIIMLAVYALSAVNNNFMNIIKKRLAKNQIATGDVMQQ